MAENLTRTIASGIRAEMARQELTQQALAPQIGMSQQALSRRLRGEHPFDTAELERVAAALGVPVAEFLSAPQRVGAA